MGLRVGLTGGLGSGKSSAAAIFAELGAHVLSADEIGRALMQPGQAVYASIVQHFGPGIVLPGSQLDRPALARLAFGEGRVEELNAIVHPATIARQAELADEILAHDPAAVILVESALIFESKFGAGWRDRFDCIILVTAPETLKVARFVTRAGGAADRAALEAEARQRLAHMIPDEQKLAWVDFVVANDGSFEALRENVTEVWAALGRGRLSASHSQENPMPQPEGITNHPASTEAAEDAKLQDAFTPPQPQQKTPAIDDHDLPKGMAEKVETIEISTMKVNK